VVVYRGHGSTMRDAMLSKILCVHVGSNTVMTKQATEEVGYATGRHSHETALEPYTYPQQH
jgi:hypothetical protein